VPLGGRVMLAKAVKARHGVGAEATTDQPGLLAARAARGHPSTLTPSRMGSLSLSA
jgi:hypothetical protein